MPLAAGFVGIIPALGLLNLKDDGVSGFQFSWLNSMGWSLAVAFFGFVSFLPVVVSKCLV
jgi:hypothetical protein